MRIKMEYRKIDWVKYAIKNICEEMHETYNRFCCLHCPFSHSFCKPEDDKEPRYWELDNIFIEMK